MSKVTRSTIRAFIKKNVGRLLIKCETSFDSTEDGVRACAVNGFTPVVVTGKLLSNTEGIEGAWFVNGSRDYFNPFMKDGLMGYGVYNSCGSFTLAIKENSNDVSNPS